METKRSLSLDSQFKKLEILEKEKEIENMERRLNNVTKGVIVDQVRTLTNLLETRLVKSSENPLSQDYSFTNAFDEEDLTKIKAKIMRLINTF
jgi:hypothetical protein